MSKSNLNLTSYKCVKCEYHECESGEMRAVGGFWAKFFDMQNLKFTTVSCKKCGYTEIYKDFKKRTGENIMDFLTN